jgi:hypothetical protein
MEQRRVGLQDGPAGIDERDPVRGALPRGPQELIGALPLGAQAREIAEDADLGAQHERVERLEDVVDRSGLVAAGDVLDVGRQRGQEDDRRVGRALAAADERGGLEAVHPRHLHVEQDRREVLLEDRAQRLLPGPGPADPRAERGQDGLEREQVLRVVVGDQDGRRVHRCSQTRISDSSWSMSTGLVM